MLPGAVVEEVDERPVSSARAVWAAVKDAPASDVLLRVWESGASRYLVVKLSG